LDKGKSGDSQNQENLQVQQNQQKVYANRQIVEHNLEVGDLVFLILQPYKHSSLKKSGEEKMKKKIIWTLSGHLESW
jgi:hypothetical protein